MKNPPCWESATIMIAVYRRSWREVFPTSDGKCARNELDRQRDLWKVPPLRKSDSVAFGSFFLMISTSALESTKRFPHLPRGPAADH
jgi:hypothetical protein